MDYRAYFLNREGHIISVETFVAENDELAIRRARALKHHHVIELWHRNRMVARFEPGG